MVVNDSYKKACLDLKRYLEISTEILVVDPGRFRMLMLLLKSPTNLDWNVAIEAFTIIDAESLIPDIKYQIDPDGVPQYFNSPASTALVNEYGKAWLPTSSPDYQRAKTANFLTDANMDYWERGVRALHSTDRNELLNLAIDPSSQIRKIAKRNLKHLEETNG